ncbi:MAG TPA: Hsp20/alpha crystallin family protein [Acidobacteriaceae bacterium]|jgi:HSP20 family protein
MAAQNEKALAPAKEEQGSSGTMSLARQLRAPEASLLMNPLDLLWFSPFGMIRRMNRELERTSGELGLLGGDAVWSPTVEVSESNGNLRLQADLPGLSPEDVKVEIGDNDIVIQGERRVEHQENHRAVRRTEREYGLFYRTIPLPQGAQVDQAKASFRNGVLEVTVPVPQRASDRQPIPIESGSGPATGSDQAPSGESKPAEPQKQAA